tara:strand:+ start:5859 stop:6191 length:333 start_codon:yes stop_codon:yes gene_type:complete
MTTKTGWLEDSIAKADGYYSPKGEKLKGASLTPEEIAAWNGEVVEEVPGPMAVEVELEEDEYYDLEAMSKKELEELGREYGIELDRRKNKDDLIEELEAAIEKWNEENEE